ncbi:hypothetical protein WMY93_000812 [Mugilogobius chulae]|uniref:Uncharacterized protein n=1 Tax=Mugilogobius chulae TaxID=88201 RepID=A0AAW0Q0C4_9GOBI
MSHVRDDALIMMEKLKSLGQRPLLLTGTFVRSKGCWEAEDLCPYDLPDQAKSIVGKIKMLYAALLEGWSPPDDVPPLIRKRKRDPTIKLFWKKKRTLKDCTAHTSVDVFPIMRLGKQRTRKGVIEIQVFWEPCRVCGKTWPFSWEPASNVILTNTNQF